jgi:hypothetical protein
VLIVGAGPPDGDAEPEDETFAVLFDLAEQPLLIRPDGHIAGRARQHASLPDVKDALNRIPGHP